MTDEQTSGAGDEIDARLELALRAADEAGRLALEWFQSPRLATERKKDGSVVTAVDREAEERIRRAVAEAFPEDGVLGEEHGETPGRSGWRWVVDPIDGTFSFTRGIPHFCTLIGIERAGEAVAGVAGYPALGEIVHARRGGGAWWTTRTGAVLPARVSALAEISPAFVELGTPRGFARVGAPEARERVSAAVRRVRGWSDGYAFALVATGRVDAAVQVGLNWWDLAPFVPIFAEAGGRLTGWDGADPPQNGKVVAAGPAMHDLLLAEIRAAADRGSDSQ